MTTRRSVQLLAIKSNGAAQADASPSRPGKCSTHGYFCCASSMYLITSPTLWSFSACSSGISLPNSSSSAMTNSTVSSESAPRSSMNLASGVTWSAFTPNCSTMMSLTLCSIVFSAMMCSSSNICCVSMPRFERRQARNRKKLHRHAAIYRQHLARDVARRRAGEEQHGVGHVVRLAQVAQRNLLQEPLARLGTDLGRHRGLDEPRGNRIHRNAPAGQLSRGGLGEANHTRLAGPVIALAGVADQADDRGNVHNAPRALLEQAAGKRLGEQERALEIDVQHGVPVRLAHAHDQTVLGDAGVVDQDVHLAGGGQDLLRNGLYAGGVGDVGREGPGLAPKPLSLLHRLGAELQLQIHAGNVRVGGSEFQGDGLADTAAGAGHYRYLIG